MEPDYTYELSFFEKVIQRKKLQKVVIRRTSPLTGKRTFVSIVVPVSDYFKALEKEEWQRYMPYLPSKVLAFIITSVHDDDWEFSYER